MHDEYNLYIPSLALLLDQGANAGAVADRLAGIQTREMELPASAEDVRDVADRVVSWYSAATRS